MRTALSTPAKTAMRKKRFNVGSSGFAEPFMSASVPTDL
jgi:hypothetical protein